MYKYSDFYQVSKLQARHFREELYLSLFSLLNFQWVQIAVLQLIMETLYTHTRIHTIHEDQ